MEVRPTLKHLNGAQGHVVFGILFRLNFRCSALYYKLLIMQRSTMLRRPVRKEPARRCTYGL